MIPWSDDPEPRPRPGMMRATPADTDADAYRSMRGLAAGILIASVIYLPILLSILVIGLGIYLGWR